MRNTVNCCVWIFIFAYAVDGFDQSCYVNETLFVPIGSQATFLAMFTLSDLNFVFDKWNSTRRTVFYAGWKCCDRTEMDFDVNFRDLWMENRTKISFQGDLFEEGNVTIVINDVQKEDNGTYRLSNYMSNRERHCWVLFVMDIYRQPSGPIEEQLPSYFYAQPSASLIRRPVINATMVWLVNGLNITQSPQFIQQDGMIWIASVSRKLHGRNITYRAIQDNGKITEVSYTVEVTYGPTSPLVLTPETEQYFVSSGHSVSNIICSVNCNPPCDLSWDKHGKDNILSLENVSSTMAGEYICTATRAGTDVVMKKSLTIHVSDEPEWYVQISPNKTVYFLSVGETVPDILCTAVCNPPCKVSWGSHAKGKVLSLGTVSAGTSGEYTCSATRDNSTRLAVKSVIVHVNDDTRFTAAIAIVASIQAVTTTVMGVCLVCICMRNKTVVCKKCSDATTARHADVKIKKSGHENNATIEMEHYEELDVGAVHPSSLRYQDIKPTGGLSDRTLEVYENTKIA